MASVTVRNAKRQLSLPSNVVSLNTSIRAVKEFECTISCLSSSCRKTISPDSVEGNLITCPTCSTMFLTECATLNNNCMILLEDNRWFKANTSVSVSALISVFNPWLAMCPIYSVQCVPKKGYQSNSNQSINSNNFIVVVF